jgi:hypothetical protein
MTQQRVSPVVITSQLPATVTQTIRGALGQSADLMQILDSAGFVLARVTSNGTINAAAVAIASGGSVSTDNVVDRAFSGPFLVMGSTVATMQTRAAANIGFIVKGAASQTADLQQWQNSAGTVLAKIDNSGNLNGSTSNSVLFRFLQNTSGAGSYLSMNNSNNSVEVIQRITTAVNLIVKGAASQTANLQEWQNSGSTVLTAVNASGTINFASGNTSATANTGAVTLPALAVGFITMQVAGTTVKVPYYAN